MVSLGCHCGGSKAARWFVSGPIQAGSSNFLLSFANEALRARTGCRKNSVDNVAIVPTIPPRYTTMKRLSSTGRLEVKAKPKDFPALPDSDNIQPGIGAPDDSAKPSQEPDLQESAPGAPDGFKLELDIGIMVGESGGKRTGLSARYVLAVITAYLGYGRWGYLAENTIAQAARCGRHRVIKAVKELEDAGLLDVNRRGKCNRYRVCPWVKFLDKIWVKPGLVRDDGLSIVQAGFVGYVKSRQGENLATWLKLGEAAEALGVSYHTVGRAAASEAVQGFVEKIHRPERHSSKNEYYVTDSSWLENRVFGPEIARPKRRALGQTYMEGDLFNANRVRKRSFRAESGLSVDRQIDQSAYELLIRTGVNRFVARSAANQWRGDPESVKQTVINAAAAAAAYYRRMERLRLPVPRFNQAGYEVATLNGARAEGHSVEPSRLARAAAARAQGGARASGGGGVTDSAFEQRKKEQIHRLLSSSGKPSPPDKTQVPVKKPQFRDKSEEDGYLRAVQAAARARSWQRWKYANFARKLDIPFDP